MKSIHLSFGKAFQLAFLFILSAFIYSANIGLANAQKPPILAKNSDDVQLCAVKPLADTQFCKFFTEYEANKYGDANAKSIAARARNEMIEILRGQIDEYYKSHKDGRRLKATWLQMIFDILEIGTSTTIDFINGERAKSVLAAALTGFQGGRTAFNRNFKVLQLQLLINKMNGDRNVVMENIYKNAKEGVENYSWLKAKNDLRNYLFAGTFGNAMDSLVETTGKDADEAEVKMETAKRNARIVGAVPQNLLDSGRTRFQILESLQNAHTMVKSGSSEEKALLGKYNNIYNSIQANPELAERFNGLAEDPDLSESFRQSLTGQLQKLKDGQELTADEYSRLFAVFSRTIGSDTALADAYTEILKANK